jgi:uncharacterized protein YerC
MPIRQIKQVNLRDELMRVRLSFDTQLAEVLVSRPDLTYVQIEKEFGISEKVIRRVMKQFNIGARSGNADERLRKRLLEIPLAFLEHETGLSRHTILRARRGQTLRPSSLRLLNNAVCNVPIRK